MGRFFILQNRYYFLRSLKTHLIIDCSNYIYTAINAAECKKTLAITVPLQQAAGIREIAGDPHAFC